MNLCVPTRAHALRTYTCVHWENALANGKHMQSFLHGLLRARCNNIQREKIQNVEGAIWKVQYEMCNIK